MVRTHAKRTQAFWIAVATIALCAVSAYRQTRLRFYPGDVLCPYVVYAVYVALIAGWWVSIMNRVMQRAMRVCLCSEAVVMLLWMSVRFVQEAFLMQDMPLMRMSGYLISIPVVLGPLLGLYAALMLGMPEEYRLPGRWYLLLVPCAFLIVLMLTNEVHHIVFLREPGETRASLEFHPTYGFVLLMAWPLALEASRLVLLYRRGRASRRRTRLWIAPMLVFISEFLFIIPYMVASFSVDVEFIELSAALFFFETMIWESCILIGLVPVNTLYSEVFDRSTVAMQIVGESGETIARSSRAPSLSPELFDRLRHELVLEMPGDKELRLHVFDGGYLVWQKDVSEFNAAIRALRKTGDQLEQEGVLLGQELRVRSEEVRIQEKSRILEGMTREVEPQLELLRDLLGELDSEAQGETGEASAQVLERVCLIGAYVKRRCNLRLTEQTEGAIVLDDLRLSFRDMCDSLTSLGVGTETLWLPGAEPTAEFSLTILDAFEQVLEYERFEPTIVRTELEDGRHFSMSVWSEGGAAGEFPGESLPVFGRADFHAACDAIPGGYRLELVDVSGDDGMTNLGGDVA